MKFQRIRKLILEDEMAAALEELEGMIEDRELNRELGVNIASFNALARDVRKGVIDFQEANLVENQIRGRVLEIIDVAENGSVLTMVAPPPTATMAAPAKKSKTSLIIGVVVGLLVVLYIIGNQNPSPTAVNNGTTEASFDMSGSNNSNNNNIVGNNNTINMVANLEEAKVGFGPQSAKFGEHLNNDPALVKAEVSIQFKEPIDYPDKKILEKLKNQIYKDVFGESAVPGDFDASAAKYSQAFIKDFQEMYKEESIEFLPQDYYTNIGIEVVYNEDQVLSISVNEESYTGGVHGNHYSQYFNYDMKTGKKVTYYDIFRGKGELGMIKKLKAALKEFSGAETPEQLEEFGYWIEELKPTENFYFTKRNICFFYPAYEIGPYVEGDNTVCLAYSEVSKHFTDGFPLNQLLD